MAQSQVPLKLRKQMLLMRAAVERVELAQHVLDVRQAATISAIVRNAMPGDRSRSVASRALDLVIRFPFAASAVSLVASRFKLPLLTFATKWGSVATVGYKLWDSWKKTHPGQAPRRRSPPLSDDRSLR
jgi:hypothetical protein